MPIKHVTQANLTDCGLACVAMVAGKSLDTVLRVAVKECGYPKEAVISIGATRYTEFGEGGYLQKGDEVFTVLYPSDIYDKESIYEAILEGWSELDGISSLHQIVR